MADVWIKILLVLAGGGVGALCRYGISLAAVRLFGSGFFWGTLIANMAGCFLIGVIAALADRVVALTPSVRLLLMTGFLGALTTFSTYAMEMVSAVKTGNLWGALVHFLANNLAGILLVFTGIEMVRLLNRGG